jgi:hypothetical protein
MRRRALAGVAIGFWLMACGGSTTSDTPGTGASSATGGGGSGGSGGSGATGGGTGGATGGTGGLGGTPAPKVGKLDLLIMVDNSLGMGDPQAFLSAALPELVNNLITPAADPTTGLLAFQPVTDIHIAVVTSSLGGHGGDQCSTSDSAFDPTKNDNAHLLPSVRPGLGTYNANNEFLWWDPTGTAASPPGEPDPPTLIANFKATVSAAGSEGCGYEAQLESWYRFLIDPNPPASVTNDGNQAVIEAPDNVILQQRADFLRPDSAVAIVMLSDENDCSIKDGSYNWIAAQLVNSSNFAYHLPKATASCAANPDDPCCQSCASQVPNPGCPALAQNGCDPNNSIWDDVGDQPNVRCWQQKRRFGIDFLYSTARYVEGLTQPTVHTDWTKDQPGGDVVPNPLFAGGRHPGLVFLTGIVGVPWQDLATSATLVEPGALEYLSAEEIAAQGRWSWLIPDSAADDPDDPLMIESTDPRSGVNPATGSPLAPPTAGPWANVVNGHEWQPNHDDLEPACLYPLPTPNPLGPCGGVNAAWCQNPSTGQYGETQYFGRAYPGTRELTVLRDIGAQAVVTSICPKITGDDPGAPDHGYDPAMRALVRKLGTVLLP